VITDDDLRTLLTDAEVPASLSPAAVRRRAGRIRRDRRLGVTAVLVVLLPAMAVGGARLTGWSPLADRSATTGAAGDLPTAFDGSGRSLPVGANGRVTLDIPHLSAWVDSQALCWGSEEQYGLGGECMVANADDVYNGSESLGSGLVGSISTVPVARADFILGDKTVHAQVVGFARYPQWRTLTAPWDGPESDAGNILIRGWDASGKLILSVGCVGGCPIPTEPAQAPQPPDPGVQAATSAPPTPAPTALADSRISVLPGVQAWPTTHGVCVGDPTSSQCVTDGDLAIDDGFALGKDVAVTIVGKPVSRASFLVGGVTVPAEVTGFASHPQWRVIAANVKLAGATGKSVELRGWDAAGELVVDYAPTR
jgi:hypothetical protein